MELVIEGISKKFGDKEVLKDISFEFEEGHIYGLLGRNGAGKTTLFNVVNDDLASDGGKVYIRENDEFRDIESDDIGYVLSTPIAPDFLTGREFIQFYMDINEDKVLEGMTADDYFDLVDLDDEDRDRLIKDYSHGMKNKVMLLLNIIADCKIWLLDEPLTSFDVVVADEMKKLLKAMRKDKIIIFSTHIMELALGLCDKIVLLKNGNLTLLEKNDMSRDEFEEYIINILKSE